VTVLPIDMLEKVDAEKLAAFLLMHDAGNLPVYVDRDYSCSGVLSPMSCR